MADYMNLSGISADAYQNYYTKNLDATRSDSLKKTLGGVSKEATDQELRGACKKFEAYFMQQIYKEMKKPIEEMKKRNGNGNQSFGTLTDYFENNTMSELFEKNAGSAGGGVGLAKMLYESMKRNRA